MRDETLPESLYACKALLSHFYPQQESLLYPFLTPDLAAALEKAPFQGKIDLKHLFSNKRWMERIHYSWFLSILENVPENTRPLFLNLFSKEDKKELKELLGIEKEEHNPPPPPFDLYLLTYLYDKVYDKEILPFELLPFSPLNALLTLSKKEITLLIDLLGIYDLSFETQKIVDNTLLNKIRAALSKEESLFLDYASKQRHRWTPPKLNLVNWDGDEKKLKTLLHYRGLSRLASAMFDEDKSFKWHLTHQLDIGRGSAITKLFAGKCDRAMIPYFKGQVLDIINRLKK